MPAMFKGQVAQKAIIRRGDQVLLMRNAKDGKWQMPGGRLHTEEDPYEAVRRECHEELAVAVRVLGIHSVGTFTSATEGEHYLVIFLCELADPDAALIPDQEEVGELRWIGRDGLDSLDIWPAYREALQRYFEDAVVA